MKPVLEQVLRSTHHLFTSPLLSIGETVISISSIVQLIISLLLVIVVARGLKKLLRHQLLVKVKIDDGNREAIAAIVSYGIGVLCFLIALQINGFNLASLAVLAGGLGVGIGLGLQDVTKNFISGLTLLLERKLRVGDFVEVGGLSGYIEEISLRSTLIRTRPGGFVIVPNSKLAENQLLNWTYDSYVSRIHLPVRVAYGSDPVLVTETLLTSAYMEPAVVSHPSPEIIFVGFGENSLNFELWVWINRIDREPQIKTALNFTIEYNLRQQGIKVPFPQLDLWLKNSEGLSSLSFNAQPTVKSEAVAAILEPPHPEAPERAKSSRISEMVSESVGVKPAKPLALRDLLPKVIYFQNFTDLELRQLIEVGYRKRLKTSEFLFRENDPGDAFYIVLSGSVEVFVEKINKHLTTLKPGKFFGELSLMLGIPRTASVRALEETILFAINHKGFEKVLQTHPELAEVIFHELGKHQEELSQRQKELRDLGLVNAEEDDKNPMVWVRNRFKNLFNF